LRKAIWQLRTALNCNEATTGHGLLIADRDWLAVKLGESTTFDVADFEDTLASTRWNRPLEISEQQVQTLKAAANLYGGDLLKGCYQDWCLYERERLQNLYLSMLNTVVAYGEAHGLHQDVIDYGERLLSREPSHELTHQRLIRTYFAMSDRTGALRQYKRCCLALTNELGVSPSQSTLDLFQGAPLHGVEVPPSISLPPREVIAAATLPNWNSILGKLDDVIKALSHLRRVLGRELP
jgi:DNA-binding SARP family transcriptional activator